MKTLTIVLTALLGLALFGCPSEKEGKDAKEDTAQSAGDEKSTDSENKDALPEDVQKKLKSLGYVQ